MVSPIDVLKKMLGAMIGGGAGDQRFENGVYIWRSGLFEKVNGRMFMLGTPGRYLVYFHNNLCPHCRRFHPLFRAFLESMGRDAEDLTVVRVVCDWFASRCSDDDAAALFREFGVRETPKIVLVRVGGDGSRTAVDLSRDTSVLRDPGRLRAALITLLNAEKGVGGV